MLRHGILGLLNYGDMTGYELRETFNRSLNYFWPVQSSQIYRELHTMQKLGWITSVTVEQNGKPDKNICSITDPGKEELVKWLGEYSEINMRSQLLMKVFFLGEQTDEKNIVFFNRLADECRQNLKELEFATYIIGGFEQMTGATDKARYWKMTLDYGKRTLLTNIDWANDCIRLLEEKQ